MARPIRVNNLPGVMVLAKALPAGTALRGGAYLLGSKWDQRLLDMMSDNTANDRQADQLASQLQVIDYQRHTSYWTGKVANLRLSSLDDILELRQIGETSIFQLKYARASLAKWMHSSPDSGSCDTPLDFDQRPGAQRGLFQTVL